MGVGLAEFHQWYRRGIAEHRIARFAFAEGDIEYELRQVDIFNNEHRSSEFLATNPAGFVPVLVKTDGEAIYETPSINLHLVDHHKPTQLGPTLDDPERSRFLSGIF